MKDGKMAFDILGRSHARQADDGEMEQTTNFFCPPSFCHLNVFAE
jgi:hypothetical protein